MTDLTVLVSPTPLLPSTTGLFTKKRFSTPIMVTLESEKEQGDSKPPSDPETDQGGLSRSRRSRSPRVVDDSLLSPPVNTWKAPRQRHRPTRSQSAPPGRRSEPQQRDNIPRSQELPEPLVYRPLPRRGLSSPGFSGTRVGELVRPPPPLFRPTTFWRKTKKSGVSGPSYSPASHLIRRSTYIAAGLTFDAPVHDLSALCVESRVGFLVPRQDALSFSFPPVPLPAPTQNTSTSFNSSIAPSSSIFSSSSATSSSTPSSSSSSSSQPSSTSTMDTDTPQFRFVYLIPVIAVFGVIFVIALIWLIQGCVTRKPRVYEPDPEVVGGPRYEFIHPGRQPERPEPEKYATDRQAYQHVDSGFAPPEPDERPETRPRSSYKTIFSPALSHTTSLAMLDMYESDDEKDEERRRQEPWETLRHRSIKRGILENVQKEKGWMDSLRARAKRPSTRQRDSEAWINDVKRRRTERPSRSKASSTAAITANHVDVASTPWSEETGFKIIQESPIVSPLLYDQQSDPAPPIRDYFSYKLLPVGSTSIPMDHTINVGLKDTRISMLPLSPPRIMSPPLENQLTFTPVPGSGPTSTNTTIMSAMTATAGLQPSNKHTSSTHTPLFARLTDRKDKRKPSQVVNIDGPLPYPNGEGNEAGGSGTIGPLRPEKRPTKLVKGRVAAGGGGKYKPISKSTHRREGAEVN